MATPYSTPSATTNSFSSPDTKRRRLQDSSSEGSDLVIAPVPGRNYSAERYRVGIPALALLPLEETPLPPDSPARAEFRELEPHITDILRQKNIDFEEHQTDVAYRTIPGDEPSEDDATLIIYADWVDDSGAQSWYDAAHEIKQVLIRSVHLRSLKVEIIGWQLTEPRFVDIVEASHPLVRAWPLVNNRIHEILEENPRLNSGWQSIDALRIGYEEAPSRPVTISITVDYGLNRSDWVREERAIKDMLDSLDQCDLADVKVEFERGNIDPSMTFPVIKPTEAGEYNEVIREHYPDRVPMGAGFGPDRYLRLGANGNVVMGPTATIGGYLEIRSKEGQWKKYAITNYHCVREAIDGYTVVEDRPGKAKEGPLEEGSELQKADQSGIGPGRKGRENITFESPSRRQHRSTVLWHDEQIEEMEEYLQHSPNDVAAQQIATMHREKKKQKISYFDQGNHLLGCLFMCSGYKQSLEEHRLDLAVLELRDTRIGSNTIPEAGQWSSPFEPPVAAGRMLSGIASCMQTGPALNRVFKVGSRTGATTGKYNHIKLDVKMPWDGLPHVRMGFSTEYVFVADRGSPFQRPFDQGHGDSGSFVFTRGGQWLGLAFGGNCKYNQEGGAVAYFTDAQVVLDWIRTRGNGYEVRLPQD
ncbi:MAG: hypothetical protein Q9191_002969 [Dirinaria sp. TL-2023a]